MLINGSFTDSDAFKSLRQLVTAVTLFALVIVFEDQLRISIAARAIAILVTAPCIAAFIVDTGSAENSRTAGFLEDPNFFAMLIVMALPLTIALCAVERDRYRKIAWGLAASAQFVALVQSSSRSGLVVFTLSAALALPIFCRFWSGLAAVNRAKLIGAAVLIAIVGAITAPPEYFDRIERLADFTMGEEGVADRSLGRRASYWSVGKGMIEESPLIGLGPASFRAEYSKSGAAVQFASSVETEAFRRRAHNTYLELAAEIGVFGLAAFCAIIVMTIQNFRRVAKRSARRGNVETYLLGTGFLISFAAGAASLLFISDQSHKFFWFLVALAVVWERRTRRPAAKAAI
jgi:O-antigen ligase